MVDLVLLLLYSLMSVGQVRGGDFELRTATFNKSLPLLEEDGFHLDDWVPLRVTVTLFPTKRPHRPRIQQRPPWRPPTTI